MVPSLLWRRRRGSGWRWQRSDTSPVTHHLRGNSHGGCNGHFLRVLLGVRRFMWGRVCPDLLQIAGWRFLDQTTSVRQHGLKNLFYHSTDVRRWGRRPGWGRRLGLFHRSGAVAVRFGAVAVRKPVRMVSPGEWETGKGHVGRVNGGTTAVPRRFKKGVWAQVCHVLPGVPIVSVVRGPFVKVAGTLWGPLVGVRFRTSASAVSRFRLGRLKVLRSYVSETASVPLTAASIRVFGGLSPVVETAWLVRSSHPMMCAVFARVCYTSALVIRSHHHHTTHAIVP